MLFQIVNAIPHFSVKAWLLAVIASGHKDTKAQRFAKSKSGMNDGAKKARKTQRESDFV